MRNKEQGTKNDDGQTSQYVTDLGVVYHKECLLEPERVVQTSSVGSIITVWSFMQAAKNKQGDGYLEELVN